LTRFHRYRELGSPSSFGPGVYSSFDTHIQLVFSTDHYYVRLLDPTRLYPVPLESGTVDGQPALVDPVLKSFKSLKIDDINNDPSPPNWDPFSWEEISTGTLTTWSGDILEFEFVHPDPPGTFGYTNIPTEPLYGRLKKITSPRGYSTTLTYKTFTQTQLQNDPALMFQLDTVTDMYGKTISFSYTSAPVGGWYAVEQIDVPDQGTISYEYNSNLLSEITHLGGDTSTFSATYDSTAQTTVMHIADKAATGTHRVKDVYLTSSEVAAPAPLKLHPSGGMLVRMTVNGANEVSYFNSTAGQLYHQQVYEGGGRLKFANSLDPREVKHYLSAWALSTTGSAIAAGTPEDFGETYELGTGSDYQAGAPSASIADDRTRVNYLYDSDYAITHQIYSDGTWESFCYNDRKQIVRYRDRLARVTRNTYDTVGNLTVQEVGLMENEPTLTIDPYAQSGPNSCAEDDIQTADYAVTTYEYYGAMDTNEHLLKKVTDPNGNVTDYEYDADHRLSKVIEPPDEAMGTRAETTYAYDDAGRLSLVTNALGHETAYEYDAQNRVTRITYEDGSTQRYVYGTADDANLLIKEVDRRNVVTKYEYDDAGRRTKVILAAATMDAMGTETAITDPALRLETMYEYLPGCDVVSKVTQGGEMSEYVYDNRHRIIEAKVHPNSNTELVTTSVYVNNQLFTTEDPYGRVTYHAYDATDGRLIRRILTTVPSISYSDFEEVMGVVRGGENAANSTSIIVDLLYDAMGQTIEAVDPRGNVQRTEYDYRGRGVARVNADGTAVEARTETIYDDASNVVEVRTPRYFDSGDTSGHNKAKAAMTYTGRNRLKTRTEALGTAVEGTETLSYDLMGRVVSRIDMRGKTWGVGYPTCCGRTTTSTDPLGHGTITHTNANGQVTHVIAVSDVSSHMSLHNPTDNKTYREVTTKYDVRGRKVAETVWLTPLGVVDLDDPPIYTGTPVHDSANPPMVSTYGLTTTWTYDDDLDDSSGLDSTFSARMAGLSLGANCDGSAVLTTAPSGERTLSIADGAGRAVRMVQLDGSGNALVSRTIAHDAVVTIAGYGDVVETTSTNQASHTTKIRADAAGRTIEAVDGAGKVTKFTYNPGGNRLSVRNPNNIGHNCVYDALGRDSQCTDTASNVTSRTYDLAGNVLTQTDAKSNSSNMVYDARGRRTKLTDRLGGETEWTYDLVGKELSMEDAESQTTTYEYDDLGRRIKTTWPDHVAMSTVGTTGYGITEVAYTPISEVLRTTDQLGDTITSVYDFAGRLTQRNARTRANSPSGTIEFTDGYTYDAGSRMLTAISGQYSNTVTRTYSEGRLASEGQTIGGQTYTTSLTYDFTVPKVTLTYPDSSVVERVPNSRGLLSTLKLGSTTVMSRTYDDGGRLTQQTFGNGIVEDFAYVADDNLPSTRETGVGDFSFTWDDNKNKTSESVTGAMSGYGWSTGMSGFDDSDRLVARNQGSGGTQLNESWDLSLVGDMDSTTTNGTTTNRTHGSAHELTAIASTSIASDLKGNILNDTDGRTFQWDWNNQMKSADINADTTPDVTFTYDALRRRTSKSVGMTTITLVSLGNSTIADYTSGSAAGSPLRSYVSTGRVDEPIVMVEKTSAGAVGAGTAELFYYHHDANWHVRGLTDAFGTVQELYVYSAFGTPRFLDSSGALITSMGNPATESPLGNRFLFTAREWDQETATYHFRARTFSPKSNRFISRDPAKYLDGVNLYSSTFVPNGIDPTGLFREPAHFYTVYAIASLCNVDEETAYNLAFHAQYPDENPSFEAIDSQIRSITQGRTQRRDISHYGFHALTGATASQRPCQLRILTEEYQRLLSEGETDLAGLVLHAIGDHYAHSYESNGELCSYNCGLGHFWDNTLPDSINTRLQGNSQWWGNWPLPMSPVRVGESVYDDYVRQLQTLFGGECDQGRIDALLGQLRANPQDPLESDDETDRREIDILANFEYSDGTSYRDRHSYEPEFNVLWQRARVRPANPIQAFQMGRRIQRRLECECGIGP